MKQLRRKNRLVITLAGPATFECQQARDTRIVVPLFEEDQSSGELRALSSFTAASITATAKPKTALCDVINSWSLTLDATSGFSEWLWDIRTTDFDLDWLLGERSRVVWVDFLIVTTENAVNYSRSAEDAVGNFFFPLRVFQAIS